MKANLQFNPPSFPQAGCQVDQHARDFFWPHPFLAQTLQGEAKLEWQALLALRFHLTALRFVQQSSPAHVGFWATLHHLRVKKTCTETRPQVRLWLRFYSLRCWVH